MVAWSIDGEVFVLKVGTRELVRLPSNTDEQFKYLELSPDGRSLVVWVDSNYGNRLGIFQEANR